MRITKISTKLVAVPACDDLVRPELRKPQSWPVATIRMGTNEGVEGLGFAFSLGGLNRSLHEILKEVADLLVGEDATRIEPILEKLRQAAGASADSGLFLMAQAAIDAALWDIRGKIAGLPLWRMVGGSREVVPGYASGQVGRDLTDADAVAAAVYLAETGLGKIKFHLALPGDFDPRREIHRANLVREAVGDDIELGCDVNCRWRFGDASRVCGELESVRLSWIEDAIAFDDYEGMALLSNRISIPLMAGERNAGIGHFRLMLEKRSISLLMIDYMMVGGITNWLKIAALAEAFNIPVVSHLVPEIQAHLVGGVPNGLMAEHKSWIWNLFHKPPAFENGNFVLPETPGLGLRFDRSVYGEDW